MFEDLMYKKNINILKLSQITGIGYNYIYKIVKNQTDFDRCGIETAKKIADVFDMDLNDIYNYKNSYFNKKIYYQDQSGWNCQKYGKLNAEINKLFLIAIEHHFSPECSSRDQQTRKIVDMEISCIKYNLLSDKTKCIMVAILNQQKILDQFLNKYNNLAELRNQSPLKERLYLTTEPYNIFPAYIAMNIAY